MHVKSNIKFVLDIRVFARCRASNGADGHLEKETVFFVSLPCYFCVFSKTHTFTWSNYFTGFAMECLTG